MTVQEWCERTGMKRNKVYSLIKRLLIATDPPGQQTPSARDENGRITQKGGYNIVEEPEAWLERNPRYKTSSPQVSSPPPENPVSGTAGQPSQTRVEEKESPDASPTWIWWVMGGVVVLGLIWALRQQPPSSPGYPQEF